MKIQEILFKDISTDEEMKNLTREMKRSEYYFMMALRFEKAGLSKVAEVYIKKAIKHEGMGE